MSAKRMSFEDGKYTLYLHDDGYTIKTERYREPWPAGDEQFVGNKFLGCIVQELFEAHEDIGKLKRELQEATANPVDRLEPGQTLSAKGQPTYHQRMMEAAEAMERSVARIADAVDALEIGSRKR